MYKKIFLLIFIQIIFFTTLFSKPCFAEIIPIYPEIGSSFKERSHVLVWENTDTENEYLYHVNTAYHPKFLIGLRTYTESNTSLFRRFLAWKIVYWVVYYQRKDLVDLRSYHFSNLDNALLSDVFVFGIGREVTEEMLLEVEEINRINRERREGLDIEEEIEVEEEEVVEVQEVVESEPEVEIEKELEEEEVEVVTSVLGKQTKVVPKVVYQENEFSWDIAPTKVEERITTIESSNDVHCRFKYVGGKSEVRFCNIPKIVIQEEKSYAMFNERCVYVSGQIQERIKIQVDEYVCKFDILKPSSWFRCNEVYLKTHTLYLTPNVFFRVLNGYNNVPLRSFSKMNGSFTLYSDYFLKQHDLVLVNTYMINNSQFNISHRASESYRLIPVFVDDLSFNSKPFTFPFQRLIGVTQWYGNTAYQQPHRGIDFGAREESVLAIGDGEVVDKGWDSYHGSCFSGGNYLKVKQSNGMYTIYFHLSDMYVNTGQRVSKGDVIAQSGNSGAWNCQPLGYHLHLETRLNRSYESHSNPVQHIEADWASVPTLGYDRYPGRLTGENPHPGR